MTEAFRSETRACRWWRDRPLPEPLAIRWNPGRGRLEGVGLVGGEPVILLDVPWRAVERLEEAGA